MFQKISNNPNTTRQRQNGMAISEFISSMNTTPQGGRVQAVNPPAHLEFRDGQQRIEEIIYKAKGLIDLYVINENFI